VRYLRLVDDVDDVIDVNRTRADATVAPRLGYDVADRHLQPTTPAGDAPQRARGLQPSRDPRVRGRRGALASTMHPGALPLLRR